jgi:two-component system CheB/CheR fusion protein
MGLNHIERIPDYLAFLENDPVEVTRLAKDLLISVTSFLRDRAIFRILEVRVRLHLLQGRKSDEALRVWVPACATGEDAYSIAMLLIEQMAETQTTCRLQVFATDVAEDALEVGRRPPTNAATPAHTRAMRRHTQYGVDHKLPVLSLSVVGVPCTRGGI